MNEPDDPKLFENQLPALLEEELAIAQRLGVHLSRVGTDEFDQAINQGTIKWAVSRDGDLPIVPKFVEGQEISHTVLTQGGPVQTAGEAEIVGEVSQYLMLEINNNSGHYQPSLASLEKGKQAFHDRGIEPLP